MKGQTDMEPPSYCCLSKEAAPGKACMEGKVTIRTSSPGPSEPGWPRTWEVSDDHSKSNVKLLEQEVVDLGLPYGSPLLCLQLPSRSLCSSH